MGVFGQVLITAITQHFAADKTLTDAVGDHLVQVLLQHDTFGEQCVGLGAREDLIKFIEAADHFLTAPGTRMNGLETDGPGVQQVLRRRPCIFERKHAEAVEYDTAHPFGKQRRPAFRRMGVMVQ
ncbi:hypothetical protein D3C84_552280 [compost metagenome]